MKGTVIKLYGKGCTVQSDPPDGQTYECFLRGRLFERPGVACAVGDRVELDSLPAPQGSGLCGDRARPIGVIHAILSRRSVLHRPPKRRGGQPQLIAANVDQLVVVSALKRPAYKTGLIDRYLIVAHRAGIKAVLCLNKIDLGTPRESAAAKAELGIYADLGYRLVFTSALTGEGCEELKELLKDKRSVLAGHSGVGKSKLAGRIQPGLTLASSRVRPSGKGRHTTSVSLLIPLDMGGELVDTPGIRELGVGDMCREELARHFVELEPLLGKCRFKSCSHIPEPGCAVKEALHKGRVRPARYASYEKLYRELGSLSH